MKLSKVSQLLLVSTIGLLGATCFTACQLVTVDWIFVAGSAGNSAGSAGQIYTYAVDSQSGALRTGPPAVSSGGTAPVAMAVTADYANLYVANQGNSTVVHFSVAANGVLTKKDSITTSAPPVSVYANAAGTFLYVVTGTTSATLTEYSLSSGTIGNATSTQKLTVPGYLNDTILPTGVTVLPNNNAVYVTAYDQSAYNPGGTVTSNANPGWIFGFAVGSGGALTATSGSPYQAGVKPSAITTDPTNRFVYATDFASNELIGYTVQNGTTLSFLVNGPFKTGNEPTSVVVDPRGIYIYLANALDSTVSAYSIALPTGTPSTIVNTTSTTIYGTDTQPVAITLEPALARFVYTANHLGNSISGFRLDPSTGALTATQATPYPSGSTPTAIIAVPHGNHATQSVAP
ncbi:MAG TPA: beta-propeller fold lactonase family protein [Terracidiphilus sp.]|nr:beta-propeller fold lactonase family protein [Terracidiphilus sp.]